MLRVYASFSVLFGVTLLDDSRTVGLRRDGRGAQDSHLWALGSRLWVGKNSVIRNIL